MNFKTQYQQQPHKLSHDERKCSLFYIEYYYLTETHDRSIPHKMHNGMAFPLSPLHSQNYAFTTRRKLLKKYQWTLPKKVENQIKYRVMSWPYERLVKYYNKLIK